MATPRRRKQPDRLELTGGSWLQVGSETLSGGYRVVLLREVSEQPLALAPGLRATAAFKASSLMLAVTA